MSKKDLFKELCTFYKGEKICPFPSDKGNNGKFWLAEEFVVNEYGMDKKDKTDFDFFNMISAYISKWAPYDFVEILNEYFDNSKITGELRKKLTKVYL